MCRDVFSFSFVSPMCRDKSVHVASTLLQFASTLYFFISSIELEVCAGCTNLREIVSGGPDDMSGLKIFREVIFILYLSHEFYNTLQALCSNLQALCYKLRALCYKLRALCSKLQALCSTLLIVTIKVRSNCQKIKISCNK
jgi:hypothetical protein